ncbi:exopolyphosphatase/guanosine-5'-triphosphate,3'-diphosphate pyrophosphatase [Christiangramia gaetbulicola]|uniref:Exopolyphosphatase/guanosine-5'-triphosphate, 3'-diphosphate pyrophosphatase n=1 Tax=Christiangramia gaetbulicola TaxID=703340 RepID=A0A2T6ALW1_9FLAO|nr:Ppx/GppA phosphatase family protein [Christiangramia gaetbulicola]PTX44790.1 exopolyphosphatase/guanosine-5'-triphosphate,3'-diphosphate pyrophosphatase [Christiangramia gaetbulicola]
MENSQDNGTPTKRIAAIDLGTNSFHAVLVDIYPDGSFRTIDKLKEMVILAEKGVDNYLSEEAMQRGLDALQRIKVLCDSQQVEEIIAFATSAIREAKNGGDFTQRMIDEVGIKARAIPGQKEAELIGYAIRHSISLDKEMVLMVDIGGGSVEFIVGNNEEFLYHNSLKLGVARMSAKFVKNDPITKEEIKALKKHYKKTLKEIADVIKEHGVTTMIGSSGTMENIGAMVASRTSLTADMTLNELEFQASDFKDLYKDFIKLNRKERKKISELDEKRIDIINPGMVLVKYLIKKFNIENIKISEAALRDGMILNFLNQERPHLHLVENFPDPRKKSIFELLRKCNWLEAHSTHVAGMALQLFDEFRDELKLEEADRELLEYATWMHDIGYYISYRKHHKHALYIIRHSDLRGFNEDEINIMANVARYHRRSTPKKRHEFYKKMEKPLRKKVKRLSALLRVADGLDRSHYQNVQKLEIDNREDIVNLYLTTMGDPELEVWGAERKSKLFQKVTGKKLEIYAVNMNDLERTQSSTGNKNTLIN